MCRDNRRCPGCRTYDARRGTDLKRQGRAYRRDVSRKAAEVAGPEAAQQIKALPLSAMPEVTRALGLDPAAVSEAPMPGLRSPYKVTVPPELLASLEQASGARATAHNPERTEHGSATAPRCTTCAAVIPDCVWGGRHPSPVSGKADTGRGPYRSPETVISLVREQAFAGKPDTQAREHLRREAHAAGLTDEQIDAAMAAGFMDWVDAVGATPVPDFATTGDPTQARFLAAQAQVSSGIPISEDGLDALLADAVTGEDYARITELATSAVGDDLRITERVDAALEDAYRKRAIATRLHVSPLPEGGNIADEIDMAQRSGYVPTEQDWYRLGIEEVRAGTVSDVHPVSLGDYDPVPHIATAARERGRAEAHQVAQDQAITDLLGPRDAALRAELDRVRGLSRPTARHRAALLDLVSANADQVPSDMAGRERYLDRMREAIDATVPEKTPASAAHKYRYPDPKNKVLPDGKDGERLYLELAGCQSVEELTSRLPYPQRAALLDGDTAARVSAAQAMLTDIAADRHRIQRLQEPTGGPGGGFGDEDTPPYPEMALSTVFDNTFRVPADRVMSPEVGLRNCEYQRRELIARADRRTHGQRVNLDQVFADFGIEDEPEYTDDYAEWDRVAELPVSGDRTGYIAAMSFDAIDGWVRRGESAWVPEIDQVAATVWEEHERLTRRAVRYPAQADEVARFTTRAVALLSAMVEAQNDPAQDRPEVVPVNPSQTETLF